MAPSEQDPNREPQNMADTTQREAHALFVTFQDTDRKHADRDISKFMKLLRDRYNYTSVESLKIPSANSEIAIVDYLKEWLERSKKDVSLLVYFAAHGGVRTGEFTLHGNRNPGSSTVRWSPIRQSFDNRASNILILVHSCHAAAALGQGTPPPLTDSMYSMSLGGQPGTIEILTACGFESVTWSSFTSLLVIVLDELARSRPIVEFDVLTLHSRLMTLCSKTHLVNLCFATSYHSTPVYVLAQGNAIHKSMTFIPSSVRIGRRSYMSTQRRGAVVEWLRK